MKGKFLLALILTLLFLGNVGHTPLLLAANEQTPPKDQNIKVDIDYNKEDRDVGLKRMEILDKALSPDLLARKRAVVQDIEQDYNIKVSALLERLTPQIASNTVVTHVEINFFDPEFESQIHATQKTSISIILDRNGLEKWLSSENPEQDAIRQIKQLIHNTFKMPEENISILIAPN